MRNFGGPEMDITVWIKASTMTDVILDFIIIVEMELVILHVVTKRYLKSLNSFDTHLLVWSVFHGLDYCSLTNVKALKTCIFCQCVMHLVIFLPGKLFLCVDLK